MSANIFIKHRAIFAGSVCLVATVALLFLSERNPMQVAHSEISKIPMLRTHVPRDSNKEHKIGDLHSPAHLSRETRPLVLPVPLVEDNSMNASVNTVESPGQRKMSLDDDILATGGVLVLPPTSVADKDKIKRLQSMRSEDWDGKANLLVNALRAGEGFQVNHDQLMAFIRGKDLLGWPERLRNWIGDELMTALCQDMPQSAFQDLISVVEERAAPAAMRDYSVQHISNLIANGVIGQEGADYIWQTLETNDSDTLSTALISLLRLSEKKPSLVPYDRVRTAAESLKTIPDERTRITAESILNDVHNN